MKFTLTPRLLLLFTGFALLLVCGLGGLIYVSARTALQDAVERALYSTALEKSTALERWFAHRRFDIISVSRSPAVLASAERLYSAGATDADAYAQLAGEMRARAGAGTPFLRLLVLNPDSGRVSVSTTPDDQGGDRGQSAYFLKGRSETYLDSIQFSPESQRTTMFVATPLHAADGRLIGVAVGELNLDDLTEIVGRHSGLRASEDSFLLNASSFFVTQPRLSADAAVLRQQVHTEASADCLAGESGTILANDYHGTPSIIHYEWLDAQQLCLIVKVYQSDIFAPSDALGRQIMIIGALMLVLGAVVSLLLTRTITRPILALQAGVARFTAGERNLSLPASAPDEVGDLARSFNQLVATVSAQELELKRYTTGLEQIIEARTEDLRASEERFRAAFEQAAVGIAHVAPDGSFLRLNRRFCTIVGYSSAEMTALTFQEITHPEDLNADLSFVRQLLDGERDEYSMEKRYLHKDGRLVWVNLSVSLMRNPDGRPNYFISVVEDISVRKQAEAQIAYQSSLLEQVDDAIVASDAQYRLTAWNAAAERLYGWKAEEVLGRSGLDFVHTEWPAVRAEEMRHTIAETGRWRGEATQTRRDGTRFPVEISSFVLHDQRGQISGYISANHDITERKRIAAELQLRAEALARSNAELEQFAYVASHDLQEPLRMVSSYTQLLARRYRGKLDADADEFIGYAVDGATRMQKLINDLLAYSRVGTRGQPFAPVDCGALLEQVLANLALAIEECGAVVSHSELPVLQGDQMQLSQLFQNLIGNALKFRGADPPRVHVAAERCDGEWRFAVRDNGIGMEAAYFERVFVIFQRLHTREEYPGTGIGLAICKKIVGRHGGRIWIESTPGAGTTFFFTLGAAPVPLTVYTEALSE